MHHHNDLCTELPAFFALQTKKKNPAEESSHLQSCFPIIRIWCTVMSPDLWKTSHKNWTFLLQERGECSLSAVFGPVGLSGSCNWLNSWKTEKHPYLRQPRVSFKRLTGSKGVRRDVHDKRQLQTIGGSVGMSVLKCGWAKADESESSWPGPNVKQLSNLVSNSFFLI